MSQAVPAIHPMVSFLGEQAVPHNPAFAAAATPAVLDAATPLAWTVVDVVAVAGPSIAPRSRSLAPSVLYTLRSPGLWVLIGVLGLYLGVWVSLPFAERLYNRPGARDPGQGPRDHRRQRRRVLTAGVRRGLADRPVRGCGVARQ
ncbi:MAG: hypothetical protein QM604_10370 [Microbacterium sp.]